MNYLKTALLVLVLTLAGCGGGGGGSTTVAGPQPDPCAVTSYSYGQVSYPDSYKGQYTVPQTSSHLDAGINRTINLQDVDVLFPKPATVNCANDNLYKANIYIEDLNRAQKLGADRVWVYNYAHINDITANTWTYSTDKVLSRELLTTIVSEAHKRGIKVFYAFQFAFNCDVQNHCLDTTNITNSELTKLMDVHRAQIVSDATFGNQIGLDGLKVELDAYSPKNNLTPELKNTYLSKVSTAIDEVRSVYAGKITYGQSNSIFDNVIVGKVDELNLSLFLGQSPAPFNVANWKTQVNNHVSNYQYWLSQDTGLQNIQTPVAWEIYTSSNTSFYTSSWVDGFCSKTQITQNSCPQLTLTADFSMQAIALEGAFQALSQQTLFRTNSISTYGYGHYDYLTPTEVSGGGAIVFPNLDNSIRNKPAEGVVKAWFAK